MITNVTVIEENMKIRVDYDKEKPIDKYDHSFAINLIGVRIALTEKEMEELADKIGSALQDYGRVVYGKV